MHDARFSQICYVRATLRPRDDHLWSSGSTSYADGYPDAKTAEWQLQPNQHYADRRRSAHEHRRCRQTLDVYSEGKDRVGGLSNDGAGLVAHRYTWRQVIGPCGVKFSACKDAIGTKGCMFIW